MPSFRSILITGGAGFVGSNLAVGFSERFPDAALTVFDNLRRRGSELNLPRLNRLGVSFVHGDIRCREDFAALPDVDLLIDCSAEPSVQAGQVGSPMPLLQNNLAGTLNCAEFARERGAAFLFLSTSRAYPIAALNQRPFREMETRFEWLPDATVPGFSPAGVSEEFPLSGARSFYGATKLAGELLLREYHAACGVPVLINRCGILAGPWQMARVDQGVVTLWVARHLYNLPLTYTGFGGTGRQVRDLLHVQDLLALLLRQLDRIELWDGRVYNVGGGRDGSVSLLELTGLCRTATGRTVPVGSRPETSSVDLRIYLSDCSRVRRDFDWTPEHGPARIVEDTAAWIRDNRQSLEPVLGG